MAVAECTRTHDWGRGTVGAFTAGRYSPHILSLCLPCTNTALCILAVWPCTELPYMVLRFDSMLLLQQQPLLTLTLLLLVDRERLVMMLGLLLRCLLTKT